MKLILSQPVIHLTLSRNESAGILRGLAHIPSHFDLDTEAARAIATLSKILTEGNNAIDSLPDDFKEWV